MNKEQEELLAQVKTYVTDIFKQKINYRFLFHNIEHTQNVVESAADILKHCAVENDDGLALLIAAWFHDSGFSTGIINKHEEESIRIANDFLKDKVESAVTEKVSSCIHATQIPQKPFAVIEQIICDADLYHLGTNKFEKFSLLLKLEQENYLNKKISDKEWNEKNIQFLKSHRYFTEYCREHLEPVKQEWLRRLENKKQSGYA